MKTSGILLAIVLGAVGVIAAPVQTAPVLISVQRNSPSVVPAGAHLAFNFDTVPGDNGPSAVTLRITDPHGVLHEFTKEYQYHGAVAVPTATTWPVGHYTVTNIKLAASRYATYMRDGTVVPDTFPSSAFGDYPYVFPTSHALDFSALDFDIAPPAGGTAVSGILDRSTTWTAAGSPYWLTDKVVIPAGITLTVAPGASVVGGGNRIEVSGRLNALGAVGNPVVLNNVVVAPSLSTAAAPYIIDIERAQLFGGAVSPTPGSQIYGSLILKDSYLANVVGDHIYVSSPVADTAIERNVFIESGGITVGTAAGSARVSIKNNMFWFPAVLRNAEINATDAVLTVFSVDPGTLAITGNSFIGVENVYYAFRLTTWATLDVTNNYFGALNDVRIGSLMRTDSTSSGPGTITVTPHLTSPAADTPAEPTAPQITVAPKPASAGTGAVAAFSATADSRLLVSYQWLKDGAPIANATDSAYTVTSATAGDAGAYSVRVVNAAGVSQSAAATLVVTSPEANAQSRLSNVSVRTAMQAGQGPLIVGFVTSSAKPILARAAGPALGNFSIAGTLADPKLELYRSGQAVVVNDDWDAALASVFSRLQAFPFITGSKDSALLATTSGSASVHALATGPGIVLVEAYDAGAASDSGRLINVSAMNQTGTGDNVLIAGFVIDGTGTKRVLIRGVGPRLADFGVGGTLADPKIEVFNAANVKLVGNDDWDPSLASTFTACNAFGLTPGSKDAALVVTLTAGGLYSVVVSGADGGSGIALVEVYEVP